jgi:dihydroorotase-like cyclic amidohydrolase
VKTGEILIKNGKVVTPQAVIDADVLTQDGKIACVTKSGEMSASQVIDASGKYVLPGIVDPHTELGADGQPASLGANLKSEGPTLLNGGVTSCCVHFRAQVPYREILGPAIAEIESSSMVNVALRTVIKLEEHLAEIPWIAKENGVTDFKFYPGPRSELFKGAWGVDDGIVYRGFGMIADLGYPAIAVTHCENWVLIAALKKSLSERGLSGQVAWSDSRPNVSEEETIVRMILYAKRTRCPLYIVHVTTAEGVNAIAGARSEGYDITGEAMPHFLAFTKFDKLDPVGKHFPALRSPEDVAASWRALNTGVISTVGSDHTPNVWKKDIAPPEDIWRPGRGATYAGAGTILPVMFTEGVAKGRITLQRLSDVCSANPARVFGMYPAKGALLPGSDADIVIVDPKKEVTINPEALFLSTDYTRFEGMKCTGWPVMTIMGGEVVAEEGNITAKPGMGRHLRRSLQAVPQVALTRAS